jgi:hypothetical protein
MGKELRYSIQVEDPETGTCSQDECRSETRLEEKGVENRAICPEQNNC